VKSLNGLKDDVTLVAGSNITITPSVNTLTISGSASGLSSVSHDGTLTGNGTNGSPLAITVPLNLSGINGPIIQATQGAGSGLGSGGNVAVFGDGEGIGVVGYGRGAGVSGSSRDGGTGVEGSGGGGDAFHHAGVGVQGGGGGSSAQSAGGEDTSGGTGVQGNGGQHDTRGGDGVVGIGGDAPHAPGTVGGTGVVGKGGVGAGGVINGLAGFFDGDVVVDGDLSSNSLHVSGTKNFKIDHPLDAAN
jgi:hypothetical protein